MAIPQDHSSPNDLNFNLNLFQPWVHARFGVTHLCRHWAAGALDMGDRTHKTYWVCTHEQTHMKHDTAYTTYNMPRRHIQHSGMTPTSTPSKNQALPCQLATMARAPPCCHSLALSSQQAYYLLSEGSQDHLIPMQSPTSIGSRNPQG